LAAPNTRSALTDVNGNNRTGTHLSTNIILKVDNYIVGAVQSLDITERQSIKMISEVGTSGTIDSAPNSSAEYSGRCQRVRFDKTRVAPAFSRGFVHVGSQRIPFDIEIHDRFHDSDEANEIITVMKNCWISEISYAYNVSDWIITENMSFQAEAMYSIQNNNNVVTGVAPGQEGTIYLNSYEQLADRGAQRGALANAGVLNAFLTDPTV
jgi:hypothetical protein